MSNDFGRVGEAYRRYSAGVRGRLRHDLVFEAVQLRLTPGSFVLDVGCGDGEMALRLARAGHTVLGIDASADMLRRAAARAELEEASVQRRVTLTVGEVVALPSDRTFDAVCCHGVLMYLDDSEAAISAMARAVAPMGILSILTRNSLSVGMREALRGDFAVARDLIRLKAKTSLGNLGLSTRGDDPDQLVSYLGKHGFGSVNWFGIRIFSDHLEEADLPTSHYRELLELEREASNRDPYRRVARLVHVLASKTQS
jgi:S-adenosylmethionine-dependent methyltransferase